jgi:hypothetical protein
MTTRVWLCQCLCPGRHALMAAADEAASEAEAQHKVRAVLRRAVAMLLQSGVMGQECAICGAKRATWRYELRRTDFASMDEARPYLEQLQLENLVMNALWGDIHKTQRPN